MNEIYGSGTTPQRSDTQRMLLVKIAKGGGASLYGTGSPEGSVVGGLGMTYWDLTDPNAPSEWLKSSGAGTNTGWVQIIA